MKEFVTVRAAALVVLVFASSGLRAEDWYWHYTKSGSSYANMSFPENWTNSLGQAGTPAAGDAVYFIDINDGGANKYRPTPDLPSTSPLEYVHISCPGQFNIQQGNLYLQAGGRGICIDSRNVANMSHWGNETYVGTGEVPYDIASGKTLAVQKTMSGASATLVLRGGGGLHMGPDDAGYSANTLGGVRIESGKLGYRIPWSRVSPAFKLSFGGNAETALLCLARGNRLVKNLDYFEAEDVTTSTHGITSSAVDGTASTTNVYLKCVGTPGRDSARFTGQLYGRAGLYWAPQAKTASEGNYAFVFAKASSTTVGDIIVSNGTVRVTEGAQLSALSSVVVEAGGVYQVDSTAGGGNFARTLRLTDATAKVSVGIGAALIVSSVVPPGTSTVATGVHTALTDSWITGDGAVFVAGSPVKGDTFVWTGEGASTSFGLADNWQGGTVPPMADGTAEVKFASGGARATLTQITSLYGLVFEGTDFVTEPSSATASLFLGAGGIATSGSGAAYALSAPTVLAAGQVWNVAEGDTLVVSNRLSGFSADVVQKKGKGRLDLFGDSDFPNVFGVTNGEFHVWSGRAFGSSTQPTWISSKNVMTTFHGVTTDEPFEFYDSRQSTSFVCAPGTTNTFNGLFNANKGNFHTDAGSGVFVFRGGMKCSGNYCPYGTTIVERTAFSLGDRVYPNATTDLHLRVPQNNFGGNNFMMVADGCQLWTEVANAFSSTRLSVRAGATFHLCGNDQTLAFLNGCTPYGEKPGICESPTPATLTLADVTPHSYENGPTSRICRVSFQGAVSLAKTGSQTIYLANESPTTGALSVSKGRLVMLTPSDGMLENQIQLKSTWTGSWTNATNVVVSGSGILEVRHSKAFGRQTDLWALGGTVELAAGVSMRMGDFYLDGVRQDPFTTYGGPDSAAAVKPKYPGTDTYVFSGTGLIRANGHNPGLLLFIR